MLTMLRLCSSQPVRITEQHALQLGLSLEPSAPALDPADQLDITLAFFGGDQQALNNYTESSPQQQQMLRNIFLGISKKSLN